MDVNISNRSDGGVDISVLPTRTTNTETITAESNLGYRDRELERVKLRHDHYRKREAAWYDTAVRRSNKIIDLRNRLDHLQKSHDACEDVYKKLVSKYGKSLAQLAEANRELARWKECGDSSTEEDQIRNIFVIAGNYQQYWNYMKETFGVSVRGRTDVVIDDVHYRYVIEQPQVRGYRPHSVKVYFVGGSWENPLTDDPWFMSGFLKRVPSENILYP